MHSWIANHFRGGEDVQICDTFVLLESARNQRFGLRKSLILCGMALWFLGFYEVVKIKAARSHLNQIDDDPVLMSTVLLRAESRLPLVASCY